MEAYEILFENNVVPKIISNLHAKVYLSESQGIITSGNLTDSGLTKNPEVGFLVKDYNELNKLNSYFNNIWEQAEFLKEEDMNSYKEILVNNKDKIKEIRVNKRAYYIHSTVGTKIKIERKPLFRRKEKVRVKKNLNICKIKRNIVIKTIYHNSRKIQVPVDYKKTIQNREYNHNIIASNTAADNINDNFTVDIIKIDSENVDSTTDISINKQLSKESEHNQDTIQELDKQKMEFKRRGTSKQGPKWFYNRLYIGALFYMLAYP